MLGALLLALPASAMAEETFVATVGSITGTVTAEGGGTLGEVEVCAEAVDKSHFKCATTTTEGTYEIAGLTPGEYNVGFWTTRNYVVQFWRDKPTWETANAVQVAAELPTSEID